MKRFLALLLLFCGAAQAQQIDYTYTQTYVGAPAPFQQLNVNQGNPLNLADDQVSNPINLGFNFTFYGQNFNSAFISSNGVLGFQGPINGCCSGYNLDNPGNRYGIFALQTDLINLQTTNPWYRTQGEQGDRTFTVGWYNMPIFYDGNFRSSFEITLFESNNNILLNYGDLNTGGRFFTAGLKGNDGEYELLYSGTNDAFLENSSYMFSFIPPPPPIPEFLYWINLTSENGVFTLTTTGVVRYGASGTYAYAELQPGTYSCSNGFFGDPIPGVYKSCEFGSNNPPVVDCSTSPGDPSCLIDDGIIDYTDPEELLAALEDDNFTNTGDNGSDNGSDDGSDDGTEVVDEEEEELLADADVISEELSVEELIADEDLSDEDLEELLAEEVFDEDEEEVVAKELVASSPIKEMVNEEKAATLSDSISKDVLESALSVAAAAETSGASGGTTSESSSSSSSSSRSSNVSGGGSEMVVASAESTSSTTTIDSSGQESSAAGDASMELLETGRVLGQEALSVTMAATEASATDSLSQAESIAQTSSSDSMTASSATAETINSIEIENVIETVAATESNNDTSVEMVGMTENTSETGNVSDGSDVFASIENNPSAASAQEAEDVALAVVNNSIASSEQKTFEDETNTDAEVTNAMVDPALAMANTFNQPPSMMNLEILGIVKPIEEKSDAERSAEKVVAANKEQQDEINKNYMDADQSGIVAAIAVDADVSSYLSARLLDNNTWYKPEDIYKGVVIKDNARGSYFLEKGNTDTYKKMVEEQYK